jgi:predicted amidophosphoribosyltransferase
MAGIYHSAQDNATPIKCLGEYHPWSRHKALGGDGSNYDRLSGSILDFKQSKVDAIRHFAGIIEPLLGSDFAICVVPSHDPAATSGPLHLLAANLCRNRGRVDASTCLVRHAKISKLAMGGNRDKQVHLESIRVVRKNLIKDQRVLLLDDVTTSGGSLEGCKELLISAGAAEVLCLVLGRTV